MLAVSALAVDQYANAHGNIIATLPVSDIPSDLHAPVREKLHQGEDCVSFRAMFASESKVSALSGPMLASAFLQWLMEEGEREGERERKRER